MQGDRGVDCYTQDNFIFILAIFSMNTHDINILQSRLEDVLDAISADIVPLSVPLSVPSRDAQGELNDDIQISLDDLFNPTLSASTQPASSDLNMAHALTLHDQLLAPPHSQDVPQVSPLPSETLHTSRALDVVGSGGCLVHCLMLINIICSLQLTYEDVINFLKNGGMCALEKAQTRKSFMKSSENNPLTLNDFANLTTLTFSHSALYYALRNMGFSLVKVFTCERLFNARSHHIFLLIGCLNFKFAGGNFPGFVQDDNSRHTKHSIIIHKGRIHCLNLTDARGKHINLSASKFLRIMFSNSNSGFSFHPSVSLQHRYLSHVNTIYKITKCAA